MNTSNNHQSEIDPAKSARSRAYAFKTSIPIMFGYVFLGIGYGLYMHNLGFSFIYPTLMAATIYGGSVEFLIANLLCQHFNPVNVVLLTAVIGFRQFFYGVSMLTKYPRHGWRKWPLIFDLSDETFVLNYYTNVPDDCDEVLVHFWINLFDYCYWVGGALLGGLPGSALNMQLKGLDFIMTALFICLAVDQIRTEKSHLSSISGAVLALASLVIFDEQYFVVAVLLLLVGEFALIYWHRQKNEPQDEKTEGGSRS